MDLGHLAHRRVCPRRRRDADARLLPRPVRRRRAARRGRRARRRRRGHRLGACSSSSRSPPLLVAAADRALAPAHAAAAAHGHAALIGKRAIVLERIANDEGVGCVKIDGEVWTARAYDEDEVYRARAIASRSSRSGAPRRSSPNEEGHDMAALDRAHRGRGLRAVRRRAHGIRIIPQARAGVVERLGRYSRTLDPGLTHRRPVHRPVKPLIDLREQVVTFPPQPVITEDNLVVGIDTVLYFTVTDAKSVPTRSPTRCRRSSSSPSRRCAT